MDNANSSDDIERVFVTEEYAAANRNPFLRYGEREKATVKKTEYKTKTVTPSGQNSGGHQFKTGGGFYVNQSGGTSVSVSFGLSWGVVNVGVSIGKASKNNIGGILVNAPNKTNYFKVKIDKKYKFQRVLVDCYQYNEYKYSYYTTWTSLYPTSSYCVKVK